MPRRPRFEVLEDRWVMAAPTLAAIGDVTVLAGAPLLIPLNGSDTDASDVLHYSITNISAISPILVQSSTALRINVSHTVPVGTTGDSSFSGNIDILLFDTLAPNTIARIKQLVAQGFYNQGEQAQAFTGFTAATVPSVAALDGKTVTITIGTASPVTFEFVDLSVRSAGATGNKAINFRSVANTTQTTPDTIDSVLRLASTAINNAGLSCSAQVLNDGKLAIHGANITLGAGTSPFSTAQVTTPMTFHRVIQSFMVQGGDPTGSGSGGTGNQFDDEFNADLQFTSTGLLAMAKSGDDTNDSQWFITTENTRWLDFNHTIFGKVVAGLDILQKAEQVAIDSYAKDSNGNLLNKPNYPLVINSVQTYTDTRNAVLMLKAPNGATGTATISVTVNDGTGNSATRTFTATLAADTNVERPFVGAVTPIDTTVNTAKTFTIPVVNVDNTSVYYDGYSPDSAIQLTVDNTTGSATVTPTGGVVGIKEILVGVRKTTPDANDSDPWDSQVVKVYIHPAAPTAVTLVQKTGQAGTVAGNNNSAADKRLEFQVTGVVVGSKVTIYADGVAIGTVDSATATTMTVTTNGTTTLTAGAHAITAVQTFETLDSAASSALSITVDQTAPQFVPASASPIAMPQTRVGHQLTYDLVGSGSSGETLTYSLTTYPSGMTINPTTGRITWTPTAAQIGSQSIIARVADAVGNASTQAFSLSVIEDIVAPAAPTAVTLVQKTGQVGTATSNNNSSSAKQLQFLVAGVQVGGKVTLRADGIVIGTVDSAAATTVTVTTNGTTTLSGGAHVITAIQTVNSIDSVASPSLSITVDTTAPQFVPASASAIAMPQTRVGRNFTYDLVTNAASGETVTFSLTTYPSGMTINPTTGRITWTSTAAQVGTQSIVAQVADAVGNVSTQAFSLAVVDNATGTVVVNLPSGTNNDRFTLRFGADSITLVNDRTNQPVTTPVLEGAAEIDFVLANGQAYQFTVDANLSTAGNPALLPYVSVLGGTGSTSNVLVIKGTAAADTFELTGNEIVANGLHTTFSNITSLQINGAAGNDLYKLSKSDVNTIVIDNAGADTIDFSGATAGITFSLALTSGQNQTISPWAHSLALRGAIENLTGSLYNDVLTGSSAANIIRGLAGNDQINGGAGADILLGGAGNDTIRSGSGSSLLIGGEGVDQIYGGKGNDIIISGRSNYDDDNASLLALLKMGAVRSVVSSAFRRTFASSGNSAVAMNLLVYDDGAADRIFGGGGHNWFMSGAADVTSSR